MGPRQPSPVGFWYRQSTRRLRATPPDQVSTLDPPAIFPGDTQIRIDPLGRLTYLHVVSPAPGTAPGEPVTWNSLFQAAGLDFAHWTPDKPREIPVTGFDTRAAWTGVYPNSPDLPLRIEAASWEGRPVFFQIAGPWSPIQSARLGFPNSPVITLIGLFLDLLFVLALFMGWRHYRSGRGDLRASTRIAQVIFASALLATLSYSRNFLLLFTPARIEVLGPALFAGIWAWAAYMAIEPYVRRRWPQSLISWTRFVNHGPKDPLVGGHILIGVALGVAWACSGNKWSGAVRQVGPTRHGLTAGPG